MKEQGVHKLKKEMEEKIRKEKLAQLTAQQEAIIKLNPKKHFHPSK